MGLPRFAASNHKRMNALRNKVQLIGRLGKDVEVMTFEELAARVASRATPLAYLYDCSLRESYGPRTCAPFPRQASIQA